MFAISIHDSLRRLVNAIALYALILFPLLVTCETLAQEPQRPPRQIIKALPLDRQITPDRHRLIVREPDGSLARSLRIVQTSDNPSQPDKIDFPGILLFDPVELKDGVAELDLSNADRVCILRSDAGIVTASSNRLLSVDEITLKAYGVLKVTVHREGNPIANEPVRVTSSSTTDGMHKLYKFVFETQTDENGVAIIKDVPPGELHVVLDFRRIEEDTLRGKVRGSRITAGQYVWVDSDTETKVNFGQQTRPIAGQFEFPRGFGKRDIRFITAQLRVDGMKSSVSLKIEQDGKFSCSDAPIGQSIMEIQGVMLAANEHIRDTFPVDISPGKTGDAAQDLGVITVRKMSSPQLALSRYEFPTTPGAKVSVNGVGPVVWIGLATVDSEPKLVFLNDKSEIVGLPTVKLAFKNQQAVACDRKRKCLYTVTIDEAKQPQRYLTAIDYQGATLWRRKLETEESPTALEFEPNSDALWLLCRGGANGQSSCGLIVFNSQGERIKKLPYDVTDMCYNATGTAFWLASQTTLFKVDAASYQEIIKANLPTLTKTASLAPAADGGVYLIERLSELVPRSVNQIWRIDRDGKAIGRIDTDVHDVISLVQVKDQLIASSRRDLGQWQSPTTFSILRIKSDLSQLEVIPTNIRSKNPTSLVPLSASPTHIDILANQQLAKLSLDGESLEIKPMGSEIKLLHSVKP